MTFEVIPAIDLIEGKVVRVERGEIGTKTVYGDDPVATAKEWEALGAPRLHVVDLEGAVAGEPRNREVIESIVRSLMIPVQVAGAIRSIELALEWLGAGADRVVLGTAALTDRDFLALSIERLGASLMVAPDAQGREVRISGWQEGTGEDVVDAAKRLASAGVPRLLVTDIRRDGMLAGPNTEILGEVASAAGIPVVASGGIASIDDLRVLNEVNGVEGVVVGKALYSGAIELSDALEAVA
ncbi:MAG: 1-(5-phosphoribosyl)-5-[(5-phosphoribosylamino)methylideneamino]imidazole-4-carboxamide isomerase [Actinomycetota bacterium]